MFQAQAQPTCSVHYRSMERLVITRTEPEWKRVEILQWMERNTMIFVDGVAWPNQAPRPSSALIDSILGIKSVLR